MGNRNAVASLLRRNLLSIFLAGIWLVLIAVASYRWRRLRQEVTQYRWQTEYLSRQAFYDSLTGLPNRALFQDRLAHALARATRQRQLIGLLLLDLDHFKRINDSLGHAAGDQVLALVAQRLQARLRGGDTLARIGGDEFVLLLDGVSSTSSAIQVAERIMEVLREPACVEGKEVRLTASIGIAVTTPGRIRPEDILREADVALYCAKTEGRDRYAVSAARGPARGVV